MSDKRVNLNRLRYENAQDGLARLAVKSFLSTQELARREHLQTIVDEYEQAICTLNSGVMMRDRKVDMSQPLR